MLLKITENKKFLQIADSTQLELEQFESSFTKKPDNWFILRKKLPHWDGDVKFMDRYNRIPIGLWGEVKKLAEKYHFPLTIEGNENLIDPDFDADDFDSWVVDHFEHSKITPRYYQNEAARKALQFLNCTEEIS
jgi:hypothetical protein